MRKIYATNSSKIEYFIGFLILFFFNLKFSLPSCLRDFYVTPLSLLPPPHRSKCNTLLSFLLQNCQLEQEQKNTSKTAIPAPPTTTTTTNTTLKSQSNATAVAAQKIPPLPPSSRATVAVVDESKSTAMEAKSLVGGVTTWFPPSSTIQVGGNQMKIPQLGTVQTPRPQYVEFLGDKKYLIIPKHNVVSVLPSVGHTHPHGGARGALPPFKGFTHEEVENSMRLAEVVQGGSFGE